MKNFKGKTAVITGAASGIGLALARRAAAAGMRLVLADIDEKSLRDAANALPRTDDCVQVVSDVSIEEDMARLARQTFERFGAVHLLFNNAGVVLARPLWEYTRSDWEWLLGVNLWSVIHSLRHFVPLMLSQEEESHIVNTASVAGFLSASGMAAYNVSKHGVVTLSETLRAELAVVTDRVNVSVLCPAWVPTAIGQAERKRPARFGETAAPTVDAAAYGERITHALASGRLSADDIARITFEAVAARHFYIIPHAKIGLAIRERMQEILAACTPNAAEDEQ